MNIALLGYGRMGHEVERLATEHGHSVALRLDVDDNAGASGITAASFEGIDVAIDFSDADAAYANIDAVSRTGVALVVGTTGWHDRLGDARRLIAERGGAMVYGSNLSIGAQLFFRLAAAAARIFEPFPQYDPYVVEHHHRGKRDAPSGTALHVADLLTGEGRRKQSIQVGNPDGPIDQAALHVASVRAGTAFGEHRVGWDSAADSIQLMHSARGREGFAGGALLAAQWIVGKQGVFEFSAVIDEILGGTDDAG